MHKWIELKENIRSPRHHRQKTSFKWTNPKQKKKQTRMLLHRKFEMIDNMWQILFAKD
jgi:hypothetical protein